MSLVTIYDGGTSSSMGESNMSMLRKADPRDGTKRGVIFCHQGGGSASTLTDVANFPNLTAILRAIAEEGYPLLATHQVGNSWGNDASITKVGLAKTYLQGTLGAKSGGVFLVGCSMGGGLAQAYARANPSHVAAMELLIPVCDLNDIVVNNRGTNAASVNAAYGGTYSNGSDGPTHSPILFASSLDTPTQCWYADSDGTCIPQTVTDTMTAIGGVDVHSMSGVHGDPVMSQVTISSVLSFLATYN